MHHDFFNRVLFAPRRSVVDSCSIVKVPAIGAFAYILRARARGGVDATFVCKKVRVSSFIDAIGIVLPSSRRLAHYLLVLLRPRDGTDEEDRGRKGE